MRRLTENDFLWSVKLGAQLRVLSYEQDYEYIYAVSSEPGYNRYRKLILCGAGQCVLCLPDVDGKAQFWTIPIKSLEDQISSGNLILNSIPQNWYQLKTNFV